MIGKFGRGTAIAILLVVLTTPTLAQTAEPPLAKSAASMQWGPCPPIFAKGCEIAVLHGNPAEPNADIFLRVAPGIDLPAHTHSSAERMILVSGELLVDYQGSPAARLRAGDYAYGPAKLPHSAKCVSKDPCTLFIAFEGPVDAAPFAGSVE